MRKDLRAESDKYRNYFPKLPPNKAWHDKLVSLVERMLELHKRSPRLPQEKESLQREIDSTDKANDKLVYELYGLSEEEIKIVES